MSPTRSRVPAVLVLALVLLGASAVAGCSVRSDDKPRAERSTTATPEPTDSATPTETPSPSPTPSPTPTSSASPTLTPEEALLTATEMPPLNDTARWTQRRTGPVDSRSFGLCARFDVLSIGAEQGVERQFSAASQGTAGTDTAAQQVATFPDSATTARAQRVLRSWHDSCASRVHRPGLRVRPVSPVSLTSGTAWWYLSSYERAGEGQFESFGVVVVGNRIALLRMDHAGQDHDYPPGQDPMELAVKAAAGKLG